MVSLTHPFTSSYAFFVQALKDLTEDASFSLQGYKACFSRITAFLTLLSVPLRRVAACV
jgi:hypothetical protein